MLRVDLDTPRKQRHTVKRIFDRLVDEHAADGVTFPMVRAFVAERRPQIKVETGRGPVNVFIPQTHRPGAGAEVDFGEVKIARPVSWSPTACAAGRVCRRAIGAPG
jgi:hypothetical protein